MQNEKHCSPENLSPNNKWQLYCAWQSPGQLSVHRAASSDLYSMNWSADISLSLLGLQLVVYLQGRCPQIHRVCSSITEIQAWLSLVANRSNLGSQELVTLWTCGKRHKVQARGWKPQSGSENIEVELKCLKLSASLWLLSFACWDKPKFVLVGKVWGSGKSEFWRMKCRLVQLCSSVISALKAVWLLIYSSLPGSLSFH